MKISELSARSGLPVATVKYYIRERLLPPGAPLARNQAAYSESHLERLKIVRALREDAGLSVREIGRIVGRMVGATAAGRDEAAGGGPDSYPDPGPDPADRHGPGSADRHDPNRGASDRHQPDAAAHADAAADADTDAALPVSPPASPPASAADPGSAEYRAAWATVQGIARDMGWAVDERDVLAGDLIRALLTIQKAWPFDTPGGQILRYARAVKEIARFELPEKWDPAGASAASMQYAVLGTYLFEPLLLTMRRLAHRERARELRAARARRGESE